MTNNTRFPKDVKKPKIELFAFKPAFNDSELTQEQRNTAVIFDVFEGPEKQQLCIKKIRSNITTINPDDGSITISCPKLPKDTDARIVVRCYPQKPDKKQKIFGYNLVLTTSGSIPIIDCNPRNEKLFIRAVGSMSRRQNMT